MLAPDYGNCLASEQWHLQVGGRCCLQLHPCTLHRSGESLEQTELHRLQGGWPGFSQHLFDRLTVSVFKKRYILLSCRELRDLMRLVKDSPCLDEQQAALRAVARIAAMSPSCCSILVDNGLIRVLPPCSTLQLAP